MRKYLDYKNRIEGFRDVKETVKVVEKSAASHIHFLKKRVRVLADYKREVSLVMARFLEFDLLKKHPLLNQNRTGKRTLLVLGGEKSMVGGLYHEIVSAFLEKREKYEEVLVLGGKIAEYLEEEGIPVRRIPAFGGEIPSSGEIKDISKGLFYLFESGGARSVDILYPKFLSLLLQRPVFSSFLPFKFDIAREESDQIGRGGGIPLFEPSKRKIFDNLLKKFIDVLFMEIVLEAKLSEFSSRTITAEHAVFKTDDIIKDINLLFLKERRKTMTQKQLESFVGHKIF